MRVCLTCSEPRALQIKAAQAESQSHGSSVKSMSENLTLKDAEIKRRDEEVSRLQLQIRAKEDELRRKEVREERETVKDSVRQGWVNLEAMKTFHVRELLGTWITAHQQDMGRCELSLGRRSYGTKTDRSPPSLLRLTKKPWRCKTPFLFLLVQPTLPLPFPISLPLPLPLLTVSLLVH